MPRALQRLHSKNHFFGNFSVDEILGTADDVPRAFSGIKVVFTIGPACQDVETLCKILEAGATIARVDMTWGDVAYHCKSLQNLNLAIKKTKHMCAVMVDTRGREIQVLRKARKTEDGWDTHDDEFHLEAGDELTLTARDVPATNSILPLVYKKLHEMASPGDVIYVSRYLQTGSDLASYLTVKEVRDMDVICEVQNKAILRGLLQIWHIERNPYGPIENKQNELPLLSEFDKNAIKEISQLYEIDFISLSHTREEEDVDDTRAFLKSVGMPSARIIAKIETKYALTRFKDIISKADGIMISRANLGLDVPAEKIALIQKNMISWCNMLGKPCVVTRVCDTMIRAPRPTRAEATDCANIILDGADGYVLGAETLRGDFPVETVTTVLHIGSVAEQQFDHARHYDYLMDEASQQQTAKEQQSGSATRTDSDTSNVDKKGSMPSTPSYPSFSNAMNAIVNVASLEESDSSAPVGQRSTVMTGLPYLSKVESIASSAVRAAEKVAAKLLIVFTHSGQTSHLVAKYRPKMPILTLVVPKVTASALSWKLEGREVARQCLLVRGLLPMLATPKASATATLKEAVITSQLRGLLGPGDRVVVIQRIHEDFALKIIGVDDLLTTTETGQPAPRKKGMMHLRTLSEVTDVERQ